MPFSGDTFTHLFDWEKDPQRQEKIVNARLEAEFDGIDTALSAVHARTVEKLSAPRTYYVRADGSDGNDGLTDNGGGAFLTIQKAIDTISATLDIAGFSVTVRLGNGTYTAPNALKNVRGFAAAGSLVIQGNSGTPGNVHVNVTGSGFSANGLNVTWDIKDLKITATGSCITCNGSRVRYGNIEFGAASSHLVCSGAGNLKAISNYNIVADAGFAHATVSYGSTIDFSFTTITLTGSRAFFRFVNAQTLGIIEATSTVFSTTVATGTRYNVVNNSVIQTNGGGANFFPGNAAGASGSGGQYL